MSFTKRLLIVQKMGQLQHPAKIFRKVMEKNETPC